MWSFVALILVILVIVHVLLVIFTRFERRITIKEKSHYGSGGGRTLMVRNMIVDTEDRIYSIYNELFLLHFRSAEIFMGLQPGNTYTVKGYGLRIPILGWFPNITSIRR